MKPKIKVNQVVRNSIASYDYKYGYYGIESTYDLIAMRFIREISNENECSNLTEVIEKESPTKSRATFGIGEAILLGFFCVLIGLGF